jgi:hypothetical protein
MPFGRKQTIRESVRLAPGLSGQLAPEKRTDTTERDFEVPKFEPIIVTDSRPLGAVLVLPVIISIAGAK